MTETSPPIYNASICARLYAFECDLSRHRVTIWLGAGDVAYMPGAIRFACRLDPLVKKITTISGDQPSTVFDLRGDGWGATGSLSVAATRKRNAR